MMFTREVGIVYVDEIDKVCSEGGGRTSSFRPASRMLRRRCLTGSSK